MDKSSLKNIIILNDLPSNIIDQAIVVFKNKPKIKNYQFAKPDEKIQKFNDKNTNYFLKEAENVITEYISKIENQDIKKNDKYEDLQGKCKKLTIISILLAFISLLFLIINLI